MEGAEEILAWAEEQGIAQFVYTHKGLSAHHILKDLGIHDYFTEIITTANGFERKPHPEGVDYLLEKYGQKDRRGPPAAWERSSTMAT